MCRERNKIAFHPVVHNHKPISFEILNMSLGIHDLIFQNKWNRMLGGPVGDRQKAHTHTNTYTGLHTHTHTHTHTENINFSEYLAMNQNKST